MCILLHIECIKYIGIYVQCKNYVTTLTDWLTYDVFKHNMHNANICPRIIMCNIDLLTCMYTPVRMMDLYAKEMDNRPKHSLTMRKQIYTYTPDIYTYCALC